MVMRAPSNLSPDASEATTSELEARAIVGTTLRVRGVGHGHSESLGVKVELQLGEHETRSFCVGQRSQGLQVRVWACPQCRGVWIPEPGAIGYTGG